MEDNLNKYALVKIAIYHSTVPLYLAVQFQALVLSLPHVSLSL